MARLGELLIRAELLTPEQVEQALRAQVVWGGRFGTNLLELGLVDLDTLARALGRQRRLPPALRRHFEKADPALQRRLKPEHAIEWSIVPLLRVGPSKLAVAAMDPPSSAARAQIADALAIAPEELVIAIAPEQRVRYQLERVYSIARSARFLRTKGPTITPFPVLGDVEVPSEADLDAGDPRPAGRASEPPHRVVVREPAEISEELAGVLEALIDEAASAAPHEVSDEPSGRERRTYARTLGELEPGERALGRIAIRKLASAGISLKADDRWPTTTLAEAARAIRRGVDREWMADQALVALERFAPACHAAMVMVVRGEIVFGWKSFAREGPAPAELAVPLHLPGLVPAAIARNAVQRGGPGALGEIDQLLLRSLGRPEQELAVVPIAIAERVLCVIVLAVEPGAEVHTAEQIALAAGAGFARLMREAAR
jgi:hypothetical protein